MKPHKHAEVIKAWADGAQIQSRMSGDEEWIVWPGQDISPYFRSDVEYRVKPQKQQLWARPYANKDVSAAILWAKHEGLLDGCPKGIWIGPAVLVWEKSE